MTDTERSALVQRGMRTTGVDSYRELGRRAALWQRTSGYVVPAHVEDADYPYDVLEQFLKSLEVELP